MPRWLLRRGGAQVLCKSPDVVKVRLSARVRAAGMAPVSPQIPIRRIFMPSVTRHARDKNHFHSLINSTRNPANNHKPSTYSQLLSQVNLVACTLHNHNSPPTHSLTLFLCTYIQTVNMAISKKLKVHTPTPGVPSLAPPRWLYHLAGHQTYTDMFSDPTRAQEG